MQLDNEVTVLLMKCSLWPTFGLRSWSSYQCFSLPFPFIIGSQAKQIQRIIDINVNRRYTYWICLSVCALGNAAILCLPSGENFCNDLLLLPTNGWRRQWMRKNSKKNTWQAGRCNSLSINDSELWNVAQHHIYLCGICSRWMLLCSMICRVGSIQTISFWCTSSIMLKDLLLHNWLQRLKLIDNIDECLQQKGLLEKQPGGGGDYYCHNFNMIKLDL
jgi:hypothetical protein